MTGKGIFYEEYLNQIRDILIGAENIINEIKRSQMYKDMNVYFRVMKHLGQIKEIPRKDNNYQLVRNGECIPEGVNYGALREILSEDELIEINKKLNKLQAEKLKSLSEFANKKEEMLLNSI